MTVSPAEVAGLMAASRSLIGVAARSLTSLGGRVSLPQWRMMLVISERGPLTLTEAAADLGTTVSSASRLADRLEEAKLAVRRPHPASRRAVLLTLTHAGRRAVDKVMRQRQRELEQVLARMDAAERAQLVESLQRFADVVEHSERAELLAL